jgi:hypothetical protein
MGIICPPKDKIPSIIFTYEKDNIEQKQYIFKVIEQYNYDKPLKFHLIPDKIFSIELENNSKKETITSIFDSNENSISTYITKFDEILNNSRNSPQSQLQTSASTSANNLNNPDQNGLFISSINIQNDVESKNEDGKNDFEELKKIKDDLFNKAIRFTNQGANDIMKEELKYMSTYGDIMKKQIKKEKKENINRFITIQEALGSESRDKELFALGLLGNLLSINKIEVAIINPNIKNEDKEGNNITCLHFITKGVFHKIKYNLIFDSTLDKNRNEKSVGFENKLKKELSKYLGISEDTIIINLISSNRAQVIFLNDEKNDLSKKFNIQTLSKNKKCSELRRINTIESSVVMSGCKLSKALLEPKGNKFNNDWGINELRGGKLYYPPLGWTGIGLKVVDEYNGDNDWIGMNNSEKEWCVAYKWIGKYNNNIIKNNAKINKIIPYSNQAHKDHDDQYHPKTKVGEGIFCTPNIKIAELFAEPLKINEKLYKIILMVRVNNNSIRGCKDAKDYWVIKGSANDIRPYRILYKEIKK